jgi:hypothetical protein
VTNVTALLVCIFEMFAMPSVLLAEQPAPGDLRAAGAVSFTVTCNPSVQADFNRGVALLHSFFYEESRRVFSAISERDPECAMAQWGIAETWWHPIWAPPTPDEFASGKAAANQAEALHASPRERGFIKAIAAYYATPASHPAGAVGQSCHGPMGTSDGATAYASAMNEVFREYPDDFEVRVFHAYAQLAVGYATPTDTTLANQREAGALLEQLWKENAHHPGVAHYIIHSYDYPGLAERALPAAQSYAAIAPWVPHALHMPSHIFTRLGMWDESIDTNRASADASVAYARQRGRNAVESEELHALDYLAYSLLQEGRDTEARAISEKIAAVHDIYPAMEFAGAYALAAIPARYTLEREAWHEAASVEIPAREQWKRFPFTQALFEYVHALGRAHTGDIAGARQAVERMRDLRKQITDPRFDYFGRHLDVQTQAAEAWIAHAENRDDDALRMLHGAADAEDSLGKHPVSPGALMPVREQLGALLIEKGRTKDALAAYQTELAIYPRRLRALYGAANAARASGNGALARTYFAQLVKQASRADAAKREVNEAKRFLADGA